jgi:hypothetical protein
VKKDQKIRKGLTLGQVEVDELVAVLKLCSADTERVGGSAGWRDGNTATFDTAAELQHVEDGPD